MSSRFCTFQRFLNGATAILIGVIGTDGGSKIFKNAQPLTNCVAGLVMERLVTSDLELGMIAGGQLAKMLIQVDGILTPRFKLYKSQTAIFSAIEKGEISFPFVQKLRKGRYDGRGVTIVARRSDLPKLLPGAAIIEGKTGDIKSSDRKHRVQITFGNDKNFRRKGVRRSGNL